MKKKKRILSWVEVRGLEVVEATLNTLKLDSDCRCVKVLTDFENRLHHKEKLHRCSSI